MKIVGGAFIKFVFYILIKFLKDTNVMAVTKLQEQSGEKINTLLRNYRQLDWDPTLKQESIIS